MNDRADCIALPDRIIGGVVGASLYTFHNTRNPPTKEVNTEDQQSFEIKVKAAYFIAV